MIAAPDVQDALSAHVFDQYVVSITNRSSPLKLNDEIRVERLPHQKAG
jgi:hypothetical protein